MSDKLIWNQAFLERTVTTLLFFLRVRGSPLTSQLSHLFGGRCHPFRTSASAQENCIFWSQIWPTKNKPCSFFPKSTSNKNTSVFWLPSLLTLQRWCFFFKPHPKQKHSSQTLTNIVSTSSLNIFDLQIDLSGNTNDTKRGYCCHSAAFRGRHCVVIPNRSSQMRRFWFLSMIGETVTSRNQGFLRHLWNHLVVGL